VAATNEPAEVTQRAVKAKTTAGTMEAMAGETATAVTPQNRHLADYSDHATIYMMSLWKRTTKRRVHVGACT
jgi:hypothetical protein